MRNWLTSLSGVIQSRRGRLVFVALVTLVVSFALFGNSLNGDFVFDDTIVVVGNPLIKGGIPDVGGIFSTSYHAFQPRTGLYRPLTILSFALNASVFGFSSLSFHVTNVVLYALGAFLLFLLVSQLVGNRAGWISLLMFLFMPIHAEAVASIVGRSELLALVFGLASLLAFHSGKYWQSGLWLLLGLLSKEVAIAVVPVTLMMSLQVRGFNWRRLAREFAPLLISAILYSLLRWNALGSFFLANDATSVYNPIKSAPFIAGLWTAMKVFAISVGKLFVPLSYSSDYSFDQIATVGSLFASWQAMAGIILLALLIGLIVWHKKTIVGAGLLFFLSGYFVISNWVFKIGTIAGERLLYLSSAGAAMVLGIIIAKIWDKLSIKWARALIVVAGIALLSWYATLIVPRSGLWNNEESLFKNAYSVAPNSVVNMTNIAYLDFKAGRLDNARKTLEKVLESTPDHPPALNLLANVQRRLGNYQISEVLWKRAIQVRPDYLNAYLNLGILYYDAQYYTSAEKVLNDAVAIYPRWNEVWYLALTKIALGKSDEAIALIEKNFSPQPAQEELKFALALAWYTKGDNIRAAEYAKSVVSPNLRTELERNIKPKDRAVILGG